MKFCSIYRRQMKCSKSQAPLCHMSALWEGSGMRAVLNGLSEKSGLHKIKSLKMCIVHNQLYQTFYLCVDLFKLYNYIVLLCIPVH